MYFDGITLGPYEVLFVKLKRLMVEGRTPGSTNALRYSNWMSASVSPFVMHITSKGAAAVFVSVVEALATFLMWRSGTEDGLATCCTELG